MRVKIVTTWNVFLKALIDAENFINEQPEKAKAIIAQRLKADPILIDKIWDSFTFELSLEQSIMLNLEDEAVWAEKLSSTRKEIPNYFDFIDKQPLTNVKPHAVNLIH